MPYLKRVVHAGNMIFVKKYFSSRYGKKNFSAKASKSAVSSQKMQETNARNAIDRLTWLINANFKDGDLHMVLTYRNEKPSPEQAAENLRRYLRKLRAEYKRAGEELKYIWVTEYQNKRIHHHVLINKFDPEIITKLWEHGSNHFTPLYSNGDYTQLATYFVKETEKTYKNDIIGGKRWNSSRNLVKPKIEKEIVEADSWTNYPKALKGYYIPKDSIEQDVDDCGYPYQKYTMIKIPEKKGKKKIDKRWRDNGTLNC